MEDYMDVLTFVDSLSGSPSDPLVRLSYFYVEISTPHPVTYNTPGFSVPMLLLGLQGILLAPIDGGSRFNSSDSISSLFTHISEQTPLVVSSGYILVPSRSIAEEGPHTFRRGEVIRVSVPAFMYALDHIRAPEHLDLDHLPYERSFYTSPEETQAFFSWSRMTIDKVKKGFRERSNYSLSDRKGRK